MLDTSGLLAALDGRQDYHAAAVRVLEDDEPLLLSPFVLAELDYLLLTRVGQVAELAFLAEVAHGAYQLEPFTAADVAAARTVIAQYEGLRLGLADASVVVLAHRHQTHRILTLDERHFRAITGPDGRAFQLLPADADH